jgi:hypothetical protein
MQEDNQVLVRDRCLGVIGQEEPNLERAIAIIAFFIREPKRARFAVVHFSMSTFKLGVI